MKLGLISPKTMHKEAMEKIKASGIEYTDEEIEKQLEEVEKE